MSEHNEQVAIFKWAKKAALKYPCLNYMYSTLNGVKLPIRLAVKCKAAGNKKGVCDIVLPYPTKKYHGLYLELKYGYNKPNSEQRDYIKYLNDNGYYATWHTGAEDSILCIESYIRGELD